MSVIKEIVAIVTATTVIVKFMVSCVGLLCSSGPGPDEVCRSVADNWPRSNFFLNPAPSEIFPLRSYALPVVSFYFVVFIRHPLKAGP